MPSFNKVILIGNLTADPELRYLPKGTAVCQFNLAVNRRWKDDSGQQKDEVSFIGVKAWGKSAETIAQYLKKGRPLMVEGRLTQESWEKDGKKNSKTIVTLESFQFLDSGNREEKPPTAGVPTGPSAKTTAAQTDDAEDDVPF